MGKNQFYPSLSQEILASLSIIGNILLSPLTRGWYSKWGSTKADLNRLLPGDNLVSEPRIYSTRGITINASSERIWPWLVQVGQERGGFYSYQRLENIGGCKIQNAERIIPEFQQLNVGDKVRLGPEGYPYFVVQEILPQEAIVLRGDSPGASTSWVFYLQPIDKNFSRLIIRYKITYEPTFGNIIMWRVITDPIHFVMERGLLKGIKSRAEVVL